MRWLPALETLENGESPVRYYRSPLDNTVSRVHTFCGQRSAPFVSDRRVRDATCGAHREILESSHGGRCTFGLKRFLNC